MDDERGFDTGAHCPRASRVPEGGVDVIRDAARGQWENVSTDPDLAADFGYALLDLEVIRTGNGGEQVMVLPKDEDLLRENAFLVVDEDALCDVVEWT